FYTTASSGTGLGLYIVRELCEINQARLSYRPLPEGGSSFRIRFTA
ncbi:MAG: ATP-binding protein, partial [Thiogranum sp.]